MSAGSVVIYLNVFEDGAFHTGSCGKAFAVDGLDLERVEKTFGTRVVVAVTFAAH